MPSLQFEPLDETTVQELVIDPDIQVPELGDADGAGEAQKEDDQLRRDAEHLRSKGEADPAEHGQKPGGGQDPVMVQNCVEVSFLLPQLRDYFPHVFIKIFHSASPAISGMPVSAPVWPNLCRSIMVSES